MLEKIFVKDPAQRITINQLKEHKWLADFEYKNILTNALQDIQKFNEIDAEIVAKMKLTDSECNILFENLHMQSLDRNSITYRIFYKKKLTNFLQTLDSTDNSKIVKFKHCFKPKCLEMNRPNLSYSLISNSSVNSNKRNKRHGIQYLLKTSQHAPILKFAYTGTMTGQPNVAPTSFDNE